MNKFSNEYEKIDRLVIDIYHDYNLTSFPINVFDLCKKMGIKLLKYSSFNEEYVNLLKKKSKDGFSFILPNGPIIFYNDYIESDERIRMTIAHEIKHIVCEDKKEDEKVERLANHFARFLLCPTPYLVKFGIDDIFQIMDMFHISYKAARNASGAMLNRVSKFGNKIFNYEKSLVDLFI